MNGPWEAPTPAVAGLLLGAARSLRGGTLEVEVAAGLPAAAPGQFVMIDVGDGALPHPFTIFRQRDGGAFTLLLRPGGRPVTALLQRRARHLALRAIGPLGRPFPPPRPGGRAWLVAEGGRIAPMWSLARALTAMAVPTTLLVGTLPGGHVDALAALQSAGVRPQRLEGDEAPALERAWAGADADDTIYLAGPEPLLARACDAAAARPQGPATYVAVEVAMACGVGACYGCPVALRAPDDPRHPYVRACTEGPVFDARQVALA